MAALCVSALLMSVCYPRNTVLLSDLGEPGGGSLMSYPLFSAKTTIGFLPLVLELGCLNEEIYGLSPGLSLISGSRNSSGQIHRLG
jgi:hypothetical protein